MKTDLEQRFLFPKRVSQILGGKCYNMD